jgi:hypothetical protein
VASTKKLLNKQAITNVSKEKMTLIPELPPIVMGAMGGEQNTADKSNNKCDDADIDPETNQTDINPANEVAVEFPAPTFLVGVCPASMFDMEEIIDNPNYVCAAKHLCQSVGNQTSMMSSCINSNHSAHHFCAKSLSEQSPVDLEIVITVTDFTKEGKIRWKKTPTLQKSNVMCCIFCQGH